MSLMVRVKGANRPLFHCPKIGDRQWVGLRSMITINFETLDERLEAYRAEQRPLRIVVKSAAQPAQAPPAAAKPELTDQDSEYITHQSIDPRKEQPIPLIHQLENEKSALLVERNKLSSQIWKMVENGATQADLAEHYRKIEEYRPGLIALYDKIKHVKLHGELPSAPTSATNMDDIYQLKDLKKKLVDKRCKLKAKIDKVRGKQEYKVPGGAEVPLSDKDTAKVLEWQFELDQAEAEYTQVAEKLSLLNG